LNKEEMADRLAARTGRSKVVARDAVDGAFPAISDALADGDEIRIAGIGIFGSRSRLDRAGANLKTGEANSISASTSPTVKAGRTLKEIVNADPGS